MYGERLLPFARRNSGSVKTKAELPLGVFIYCARESKLGLDQVPMQLLGCLVLNTWATLECVLLDAQRNVWRDRASTRRLRTDHQRLDFIAMNFSGHFYFHECPADLNRAVRPHEEHRLVLKARVRSFIKIMNIIKNNWS